MCTGKIAEVQEIFIYNKTMLRALNKKKKRGNYYEFEKMIALLCCGAMVTGALLSGCGNAFESSSDKGETTAEGAASSGSTDSPAAEGDDSVYTVRVWGYGDANSDDLKAVSEK